MAITIEEVKKVSKLANLPITEAEDKKYAEQLSAVLEYIEQLQKVDTKRIEPTYNSTGLTNVFRADQPSESLSQDEALQNAGEKKQGFFVTKGVFEQE
jgi:aspartyl-tRNA(Asn)/glutamyl-tRNA(Gln) amidotransferase subunit C